jgi:glucose 1-dehydrogenase
VTGAASGIGRATARRLAADGAAVVVDHLGDAEAAGVLVAEIERDGGRALAVEADVSDETQVEKPFALLDMPLEEWNAVLALNLTGPFLCARALARGPTILARPGGNRDDDR